MFYTSYGKEVDYISRMLRNLPEDMSKMYESDVYFANSLAQLPATINHEVANAKTRKPLEDGYYLPIHSDDVRRVLLRVEPYHDTIRLDNICALVTALYVPPEVESLTLKLGHDEFCWFADSDTRTVQELLTSERALMGTILRELRLLPSPGPVLRYAGTPKCLSMEGRDYARIEMVSPFLFLASIAYHTVEVQTYPSTELFVEGADGYDIDLMIEPDMSRLSFACDHKRKGPQPLINSGGLISRRFIFGTPRELELVETIDKRLPVAKNDTQTYQRRIEW